MALSEQQISDFRDAAKPLVKWLNENMHPHVAVIVTPTGSELFEGIAPVPINDFIKD